MKAKIKQIQKILGIPDEFSHISIPWATLKDLEEKGLLDLTQQQNEGPTIESLITFFKGTPATLIPDLEFEGYVVETSRDDTRLTITGIKGTITDSSLAQILHDCFRHADEWEFDVVKHTFRAWWD